MLTFIVFIQGKVNYLMRAMKNNKIALHKKSVFKYDFVRNNVVVCQRFADLNIVIDFETIAKINIS